MITYQDILYSVLLETGQWIGGLEATAISKQQMDIIIKRELGQYSRFIPNVVTRTIPIGGQYRFSEEVDGQIPLQVTSVAAENNAYTAGYRRGNNTIGISNWQYNAPVLQLRFPGVSDRLYIVTYTVPHVYRDDVIQTIDIENQKFMSLVAARFMITLGRSRRAFLLNDLPFQMDSDMLITEGQDLYERTMQDIMTNSSFYLAILR